MTSMGVLQIVVFFGIVALITKPMGLYMSRLFQGQRTFLHPLLRRLESSVYKFCGIREDVEQRWTHYAGGVLSFSIFSFLFVYALQRLQGVLPLNPQGFGTKVMSPDLAYNTAISFLTNTNWQAYTPEQTMSYLVQMAALAVQNFASAAVGIAVAIAIIRGFARQQCDSIGNFWVDLTRSTVYILLPISFVAALLFCSQGAIQNFHPYITAKTVEGATQVIPQGPLASQEAIKMLGTNGGGFFNANSSHPFENPTPFTNFMQVILIFIIPAGLTYTFGHMVADTRQGWAIFAAMALMFLVGVFICYGFEQAGNPILAKLGIENADTVRQAGGNMEGKETRFGIAASSLFTTVTTNASCGAINTAHDALTPIGGLVPMFNIQTDEVIFGGVGSGLYGMLLYAIVAVFIAGLMVGRTPEYLGKKIQQKEVKMAMLPILATSFLILVLTAMSIVAPFAKNGYWNPPGPAIANLNNGGPHGFSEILYAFSEAAANNGSAFAGLSSNTPFYNVALGLTMLVGRVAFIVPVLAIAGNMGAKKYSAPSLGTFATDNALFAALLVSVIFIIAVLSFFPALCLGPLVEHFLMLSGRTF